jgi:tetratricopeptide (TPR) repeat protein/two-component sensor histidine kinase
MFKKARLSALLLLFFSVSAAFAQDATLDSIKRIVQNPKIHDTTKLYAIAAAIDEHSQYEQTTKELNKLLGNLALKNYNRKASPELHKKYTRYLGAYYNNISLAYDKRGDIVNAIGCIDKSISLFKSIGSYDEMYYATIGKAVTLTRIYEYKRAISYLFTALKYFEKDKMGNADEIAYIQSTIANIYADQGKYRESIAYNKNVIAYYDSKASITAGEVFTKSSAYANCGSSYLALKKYPEAINNYQKALQLLRKIGDRGSASVVLTKIAAVKIDQSKWDEAESLLKEAMEGGIDEMTKANAYIRFGELYYKKKDNEKAVFYLNKGFPLSKEYQLLELQEQASLLLYKISSEEKDFQKALEMYQFHDQLIDSGKTETAKNILAQHQLKYGFEKKELNYKLTTGKEKEARKNQLLFFSVVILFLVLGGYFYYRNNRQKETIMLLEKNQIKQKFLISQMNPHFIFNSLQNIRNLIYNKQDDTAVAYLDKFSKLTRQILENSNENYISLAEEIEMTRNYLAIQQLLYDKAFDFNITVENTIDTESVFVPPMLTQPFIENAIKHGLGTKEAGGRVDIVYSLDANKLLFEVTDNGKGFDTIKNEGSHKSMATEITRERLVNYTKNQYFIVQAANVVDKDDNVIGAKVAFEIPYMQDS